MRPTIVLLSTAEGRDELAARLRAVGDYREDRLTVGDYREDGLTVGDCEFGVDLSDEVAAEFEVDELAEVVERLGTFASVCLEYRGVPCVRGLLAAVLPGLPGLLDTNFGELIEFDAVLDRFRADPGWDWTRRSAGG